MTEIPSAKRKKRFSQETVNDLLFWGAHLCIVGVSLAIVWSKINAQTLVLEKIFRAQAAETALMQKQLDVVEASAKAQQEETERARKAEEARNEQFNAASDSLNGVLLQVGQIGADVKDTLAKARETSELVFRLVAQGTEKAQAAEQAAKDAAGAATQASQNASSAAGAAYRAASVSSRTGSVVASKVVTSAAREQLNAQKAALAQKQAQLRRTIRSVKQNGPSLWQKLTGQ